MSLTLSKVSSCNFVICSLIEFLLQDLNLILIEKFLQLKVRHPANLALDHDSSVNVVQVVYKDISKLIKIH